MDMHSLIAKGEWRLGSITTGGDFQRSKSRGFDHGTLSMMHNLYRLLMA